MFSRLLSSLSAVVRGVKVPHTLLAVLLLALAPGSHAGETRESLAQRHDAAWKLYGQEKFAAAEKENRKVVEIATQLLGAEQSETLNYRWELSSILSRQNKFAAAVREQRAVIAVMERVVGAEHRPLPRCQPVATYFFRSAAYPAARMFAQTWTCGEPRKYQIMSGPSTCHTSQTPSLPMSPLL